MRLVDRTTLDLIATRLPRSSTDMGTIVAVGVSEKGNLIFHLATGERTEVSVREDDQRFHFHLYFMEMDFAIEKSRVLGMAN